MDLSYESKKLHTTYCKNPKHYPSNLMSTSGVDFDFRKSIDLGGHIAVNRFSEKIRRK